MTTPLAVRSVSSAGYYSMRLKGFLFLLSAIAIVAALSIYGSKGLNSWALYQAIEDGDAKRVRDLARSGVNIDVQYLRGLTPLLTALDRDEQEVYEVLLEEGADPNKLVLNGISVMHRAASHEDSWWLQMAIAHGGDVDLINIGNGRTPKSTPIFDAIYGSSANCIQTLIDAKADLNWENGKGDIPLNESCSKSRYDFVLMLLKAGADFQKKDGAGSSLVDEIKFRSNAFPFGDEQDGFFVQVQQWLRDRKAL